MAGPSELDRELKTLASDLRRLEGEYTMYFAGRLPRPPWETRTRVEATLKRLGRGRIDHAATRFQLSTLQARYTAFADLWDRALRAKEEGRPGPFGPRSTAVPADRDTRDEGTGRVVTFADPTRERDKLDSLYGAVLAARRATGEGDVAFDRFAELVRQQVKHLQSADAPAVSFRVGTKDGKVTLTVRAVRKKTGEAEGPGGRAGGEAG